MSQPTKIAIATEDGTHVSAHFGRAPYFEVLTIENGKVIARERRDKAFHQGEHQHSHSESGHDTHAGGMIAVIRDCTAVVAGGMGNPAHAAIRSAGLTPILTDEREIDRVAQAYANGTLSNRPERLH